MLRSGRKNAAPTACLTALAITPGDQSSGAPRPITSKALAATPAGGREEQAFAPLRPEQPILAHGGQRATQRLIEMGKPAAQRRAMGFMGEHAGA
jgi:hypothetical protein